MLLGKVNSELQFTSLFSLNNIFYGSTSQPKSLAVFDKKVFELRGNKVRETKYNSLFDYCSQEMQMSYKTIHMKSDQTFDGNDLKDLQNYKSFDKYFTDPTELGSGGFGKIFKVKDKLHQQFFAVKRIPLKGKIIKT